MSELNGVASMADITSGCGRRAGRAHPTPARCAVLVALCAWVLLGAPAAAWAAETPSLFGYMATKKPDVAIFKKWGETLDKNRAEEAKPEAQCGGRAGCKYQDWLSFQDQSKGSGEKRLLEVVNTYVNKGTYITDPKNWGVPDYWASPGEWFKKFGDCEDYAITKYVTLKRLGWKTDDMRIVVVKDMNLNVPHAVLVVYIGGQPMLLDNQIAVLFDPNRVRHYQPVYALNENAWWRFSATR
jgi:predicted transglutaminase-like cysteine proteinase